MAGIDNSIYCYILKHLSGLDDTEFRQSVLTKELLVYNDTLRSNLVNGRSGNHLVYWPDDAQSSLWRNGADTSKEVKAEFEKLDKKAGEQKFPNKMETEYSFSSLAYDVLLRHMSKYSSEYKGKELVAVKEAICWCLDSQCLPESFSNDIWSQNSFEEIATFIISSVEKAKAKGVKNRTTQTATAALRKLKKVYYSELSSKENLEKTLAEIDPSVCPSASSENDISASWAGAVKKHCNYFNFLVKEQDNNLVGCSFWLPTDEKYKEHILNGTLFEESLSESFTPFFPRPGDYLFTILSLNILNEEDTEHITLKTKSNLKILLDSLWNTLIDYAKKGIFFKTLYANVPVDTAFWGNLGFVKHSEANGVFFLDMTTISDGVCPKELQQLYAEHFEKKGFMKAISLLKQASKNAPKKGIITIAAAVFVFLFVLGAAKIISPPRPTVDEPEGPEITAEVVENYTIELVPIKTMSLLDFNNNLEIIKKRLDVLCNGEEYSLETDNQTLTVTLPKSVFHDEEPEDIMLAYVAQAINLYLYDRHNYSIFGGDSLQIERKDIESVSCKAGTIEGLDIANFNIEAEPYLYIEIILTPECAEKIAAEISEWNEPCFGHDITCNIWPSFSPFLDLEHRAIYLPGDVKDSHFADLMVHLYREEPLTDSLVVEINREIEWESTADATYPGANQCDLKDLQGPTVQVVYTSYKEDKDSGDWVDSEIGFKKRLDLLEQPYAFGTFVGSDGYINAVIRTSPERMGAPIMSLLSCYKNDFLYVSGNKHVDCDGYDTSAKIITNDDGSKEYRVETLVSDWYETTNFRDLLPELEEGETCELKLCLDFVPILSAYVDNSLEEKQVSFTHLSFNDHEALSASNEWVLALIDAILNDSRIISFTPISFEFYDEEGEIDDDGAFGTHYAEYIDKLNASMKALRKETLFSYTSTNPGDLYVYTRLPVDENLPESCVEMAEKMFYAADFENSILSFMNIILIDEDDVEKERARITFYKHRYQEDLTYNTIFTNGRLDKYSAEFESAMNSSSFFANLEHFNSLGSNFT